VTVHRPPFTRAKGAIASRARVGRRAGHLTRRERQIVALLLDGCSNKGIARRLHVKEQTVKNALSIIYEKVGVKTRLALALYAVKHPHRVA